MYFTRLFYFYSQSKNNSIVGRTVIHPLTPSIWENWGLQNYMACPRVQSVIVSSLGLCRASGTLKPMCWPLPAGLCHPRRETDGQQAEPLGTSLSASLSVPPSACYSTEMMLVMGENREGAPGMTEWRCGRREGCEGLEEGDQASRMLSFKSEPTRMGHRPPGHCSFFILRVKSTH